MPTSLRPRARAPRLVAFAGLPGTGKSSVARALAARLGAPLFDKDRVREALFGPRHVAYSRAQDDLVVRCLLAAAEQLFASGAAELALLDGRTFARHEQVDELVRWARERAVELAWIECRCPSETARARLASDACDGRHPALDRGPALHDRLRAEAEPLDVHALVLDTEREPPEQLIERALAWLATPPARSPA